MTLGLPVGRGLNLLGASQFFPPPPAGESLTCPLLLYRHVSKGQPSGFQMVVFRAVLGSQNNGTESTELALARSPPPPRSPHY